MIICACSARLTCLLMILSKIVGPSESARAAFAWAAADSDAMDTFDLNVAGTMDLGLQRRLNPAVLSTERRTICIKFGFQTRILVCNLSFALLL